MEEKLELRCEQALRASPSLAVPRELFASFVEARPGATHIDDLLLACAALRGVRPALDRLERDFFAELPKILGKLRLSDDAVSELGQRLRMALLVGDSERPARLAGYAGVGPLGGWLRAVATREALSDLRRPARFEGDFDAELLGFATADDEATAALRTSYARELEAALKAALAELSPRDRNILRLYVLDGANIEAIGRLYGVHRATVARWISEIRVTLATRARERVAGRASASEVQSLARLCFSQIDLSLERLLEPAPG